MSPATVSFHCAIASHPTSGQAFTKTPFSWDCFELQVTENLASTKSLFISQNKKSVLTLMVA